MFKTVHKFRVTFLKCKQKTIHKQNNIVIHEFLDFFTSTFLEIK